MSSSQNPEVECPSCGIRNVWFADVCSSCGSSLAGASLENSGSPEGIEAEGLQRDIEKPCPDCGMGNTVSSQFCASCGTSLSGIIPASAGTGENIGVENVLHNAEKRCPNCSMVNFSSGQFCSFCGASLGTPDVGSPSIPENPEGSPRPSNYLPQAILSTICCCLIPGIVAIVFAAQVNGKWDSGDQDGAEKAAAQAKLWVWIAFGLGIASWVLYIILMNLIPALYAL